MPTISTLKRIENKHDVYRGRECIEKFFESLREHTIEIIEFEREKIKSLKMNSRNDIKMQKSAILEEKNLKTHMLAIKNIIKIGTIVIIQGKIEVLHIEYVI